MNYTLTWNQGLGRISSQRYLFETDEKPELDFEFDSLYFEPNTNLLMKVINEESIALSEEEIEKCKYFCDNFMKVSDYPVQAYEKESKVYQGFMLKSEAIKSDYGYFIGPNPEYPIVKLVDNKWERIVCVILEDGSYRLLPDNICNLCTIFLTKDEWASWPKPRTNFDIWDFKEEKWKDSRTVESYKLQLDYYIRQNFIKARSQVIGEIPYNELATWPWQLAEATIINNKLKQDTPFIDAMLAEMKKNGVTKTKEEIANSILANNSNDYMSAVGKIHGEMYAWIEKVRLCLSLNELDNLANDFIAKYNTYPLVSEFKDIQLED